MSLRAHGIQSLSDWTPPPGQQDLRDEYLQVLRTSAGAVTRDGPVHLTASCVVIDLATESVLLTLHRRARSWMQFGGHLEPGDACLAAAGLREAIEESGIADMQLSGDPDPLSAQPVDLHRHRLSATFGSCREHLDVMFLARASANTAPQISAESLDVAWWPLAALPSRIVADLPDRLSRICGDIRR